MREFSNFSPGQPKISPKRPLKSELSPRTLETLTWDWREKVLIACPVPQVHRNGFSVRRKRAGFELNLGCCRRCLFRQHI